MPTRRCFLLTAALLAAELLAAASPALAQDAQEESVWRLLQGGGHVVLIRHAQTVSGVGDPAHFKLGDCSTQRNLSEQGKADAARIGLAFRTRDIPVDAVYSSRWCRCLDTAHLAFGQAIPAPWIDSTFTGDEATRAERTRVTLNALAGRSGKGNVVLVTHAVNIQSLSGVYPASGEMVVAALETPDSFRVVGRIAVPKY